MNKNMNKKNKKIFLLLFGFVLYPASSQATGWYTPETVERVISADTFQLESGKKVHLIGVDAPEDEPNLKAREDAERTGQSVEEIAAKGKIATAWVKDHVQGRNVILEYDKKREDERGTEQVYAYLYEESSFYEEVTEIQIFDDIRFDWWQLPKKVETVFLNATIIRAGYATPETVPPNVQYADRLERVFWEAKETNEGLWNVDYFSIPCKEEGEKIGICVGCVTRCCKPSVPIFDVKVDGKCQKTPAPGSGGYCSDCGDNVCRSQYLEDSCNCPEDCG